MASDEAKLRPSVTSVEIKVAKMMWLQSKLLLKPWFDLFSNSYLKPCIASRMSTAFDANLLSFTFTTFTLT